MDNAVRLKIPYLKWMIISVYYDTLKIRVHDDLCSYVHWVLQVI